MEKNIKVTTSSYSRFHIFDQAKQLHRYGMLHRLITTYPKFKVNQWGIPSNKTISLLANELYGRIMAKTVHFLSPKTQNNMRKLVHRMFSNRLAHYLPLDSTIFIGLPSFCLEALSKAKEAGVCTIVDHGSLYQRMERRLLEEECELWDVPFLENICANWIIEMEDEEFHKADYISVMSNVAKSSFIDAGFPEEKILVNQCGVDLEAFRPGKKEDNVFRIIQNGVSFGKGVQYLLKAFTELRLPDSELWFIGDLSRSRYIVPVYERYKSNNVFFKGSFPQGHLHKLYAQGSVFVLPSIADGFGMVVPQAMSCGLPVIVTENVGASDIINDGINGFIIPIRDVNALKEKLVFLYENPGICKDMGQNAYESVKSGWSWDSYGDRLVTNIKKCMHEKHS